MHLRTCGTRLLCKTDFGWCNKTEGILKVEHWKSILHCYYEVCVVVVRPTWLMDGTGAPFMKKLAHPLPYCILHCRLFIVVYYFLLFGDLFLDILIQSLFCSRPYVVVGFSHVGRDTSSGIGKLNFVVVWEEFWDWSCPYNICAHCFLEN